jgi:hypothetical protein
MNRIITLKEVLTTMERCDHKGKPIPFDLTCITADRVRKTGGDILELKSASLTRKNKKLPRYVREIGIPKKKRQNHWHNQTRNILLPNGQVRKVHIRLIVMFNGNPVVY